MKKNKWKTYTQNIYDKIVYDIMLFNGKIYNNCYPNANTFHCLDNNNVINGKDVKMIRESIKGE